MNVSYNWLRAFVPFTLSPAELRDLITMHTATVDELVELRADLAPIVVARVVSAEPHPNSDHLWVTRVDAGGPELLDVVCGAPNVEAGRLYPFAPSGTTMPDGLVIERRKIRGAVSNGMLCSARELGLGGDGGGIMALDTDAAPGTPFLRAYPTGDARLVVDVLPNRPDLLSHAGIAREVAAITGLGMRLPAVEGEPGSAPAAADAGVPAVAVRVEAAEDAPRYAGATVRGVRVGASPPWLVDRLAAVGVRSINNVVDATNYVLHELGQPIHAFDAAKLAGGQIVVRRAHAGERITTLDGVERALTPEMTVIADAERAQAVAGVMGGRESEVDTTTTTLFVESAVFDAVRTRRTRRALGLSTDASYRFERGVDRELPVFALERVVQVIQAVAGGELVGAPVALSAGDREEAVVLLRVSRVARVLGEPLDASTIAQLLGSISFGISEAGDPDVLAVAVPSWRSDVTREADLVEEVARLHGYDRFPAALRPSRPGSAPEAPLVGLVRRVREALVAGGLLETRPMPFTAGRDGGAGYVRLLNPLAENEAYLRREVLDTLARRAEHNLAQMQRDLRLFEIGDAFERVDGGLPREETRAAALIMGRRRPAHFTDPLAPELVDEWDAKALAEVVARTAFPGGTVTLVPGEGAVLWTVAVDGAPVGSVTRVALDAPVWAAPAFGVELTLATLSAAPVAALGEAAAALLPATAAPASRRLVPLASTPAAERDLTLVVPDELPAARVEEVVRREGGELLERLELLREYRGSGVPAGARSLSWRLTLRHPERTLRDKEIEGRLQKLLRALEGELGVRPRV
jgi:phenylalanyl-tRNA synthetase beta chain